MAGQSLITTIFPARTRSAALAMAVMAVAALLVPDPRAQEAPITTDRLLDMPLEELLKIKITTASLRPQEVREVPATTYVVTEEDFRAYGYRDLKDILRNLPGIDYVWPGSHLYGGQRGFSSFWELTKLLINGREVNAMTGDAAFIVTQFNLTGVKRVESSKGPLRFYTDRKPFRASSISLPRTPRTIPKAASWPASSGEATSRATTETPLSIRWPRGDPWLWRRGNTWRAGRDPTIPTS